MFEIKLYTEDFEDMARRMGAAIDQVPFALSRALNDAVKETRQTLIDDVWPRAVTVRNTGFIAWALRTEFSTKTKLRATIYDQTEDRVNLKRHDVGGIKRSQSGGRMIIPTRNVKYTQHGATKSQLPANLAHKVVIGNRIYQAQGRGKARKLVLMWTLHDTATQPADVPFHYEFERVMREATARSFPQRMIEAMATRR